MSNIKTFFFKSFWGLLLIIIFFGFILSGFYQLINKANALELNTEIRTLALAAYWEARFEPLKGQEAIMHVVMTRVFSSKYPNTVKEVVYQHRGNYYQFNFLNRVGAHSGAKGKNIKLPINNKTNYLVDIAKKIYEGDILPPKDLLGVTMYMNPRIVSNRIKNKWKKTHKPKATIASHQFWIQK